MWHFDAWFLRMCTPTFLFIDWCPLHHTSPIRLPHPNCLCFLIFKSFMAFLYSFTSKSLHTHFFNALNLWFASFILAQHMYLPFHCSPSSNSLAGQTHLYSWMVLWPVQLPNLEDGANPADIQVLPICCGCCLLVSLGWRAFGTLHHSTIHPLYLHHHLSQWNWRTLLSFLPEPLSASIK